jgi:hypothetical protein
VEFTIDVVHVGLDRGDADEQRLGDLRGGVPERRELKDRQFSRSQLRRRELAASTREELSELRPIAVRVSVSRPGSSCSRE